MPVYKVWGIQSMEFEAFLAVRLDTLLKVCSSFCTIHVRTCYLYLPSLDVCRIFAVNMVSLKCWVVRFRFSPFERAVAVFMFLSDLLYLLTLQSLGRYILLRHLPLAACATPLIRGEFLRWYALSVRKYGISASVRAWISPLHLN